MSSSIVIQILSRNLKKRGRTKDPYRKSSTEYNKDRKKAVKPILDRIKDVPCMDCNGRFPPVCMDFDHRDTSSKKFVIGSSLTMSIEALLKEVAKCDIICSNCHRIRTLEKGQHRYYPKKRKK